MKKFLTVFLVLLFAVSIAGCAKRPAEKTEPTPPEETDIPEVIESVPEQPAEDVMWPKEWPQGFPEMPSGASLVLNEDTSGKPVSVVAEMKNTVFKAWRTGTLTAAGFGAGDIFTDGSYFIALTETGSNVKAEITPVTEREIPAGYEMVVPYTGNGVVYGIETSGDTSSSRQLIMVIVGDNAQIGAAAYFKTVLAAGYIETGYGSMTLVGDKWTCEMMTDGYDSAEGRAVFTFLIF